MDASKKILVVTGIIVFDFELLIGGLSRHRTTVAKSRLTALGSSNKPHPGSHWLVWLLSLRLDGKRHLFVKVLPERCIFVADI
jgi:hypothetical protein